jgi:hypothetical protein
MLHDNLVTFLREEYHDGNLRADPDQFCTVAFLEHLAGFIEAQAGARCRHCDAIAADLSRQVQNLERWVRWLLPRRRGGRP